MSTRPLPAPGAGAAIGRGAGLTRLCNLAAGAIGAAYRRYRLNKDAQTMMSLDDRMLRDIGVGRSAILSAVYGTNVDPRQTGHADR